MTTTLSQAFVRNFLGHAPGWYKLVVVGFLVANPLLLILAGPAVTGWALLAEFIFTLAMALRSHAHTLVAASDARKALAASALSRSRDRLGDTVRRFKGRLGKAEGIVAGARYIAGADLQSCEFAIAVADQWQGCGIGVRLLRELIAIASRSGITQIVGDTLATNVAMYALCLDYKDDAVHLPAILKKRR